MKKVKIMYDFDGTLSPLNMQDFTLIKELGYDNPDDFWKVSNTPVFEQDMDNVLASLWTIQRLAKEKNIKVTKEWLKSHGKNIEYYKGVESYFKNLNQYGKSKGVEVEHYIISAGSREIIEGTKIAKYFKNIYASFYAYDDNGEAYYPCQVINFTNKTQFLFRIEKNVMDYTDNRVNDYFKPEERFPFANMVYIGDGLTDIPCMRVVKEKGGTSIAVYNPEKDSSKAIAKSIYDAGRVQIYAPADYSKGSELFKYLQGIIDKVALSD